MKSGTSGGGRQAKIGLLLAEVADNSWEHTALLVTVINFGN